MNNLFDRVHSYATAIIELGRKENTDITKAISEIAVVLDNTITKIEEEQKKALSGER